MKNHRIFAAISALSCLFSSVHAVAKAPAKPPSKLPAGTVANAIHEKAYEAATAQKSMPTSGFTTPVQSAFPFDKDTANGEKCLVNQAEVPISLKGATNGTAPLRFKGDFEIKQDIRIKNFVTTLESPTASRDVFAVRVSFDIDDLSVKSTKAVDISYECVGLDRNFTITLKGIQGSILYGAPSTKTDKFSYEKTTIKIGSIAVASDGDAFKKLLNDAVQSVIEGQKPELEKTLASQLGTAGGPGVATILSLGFIGTMGLSSSKKIHDARYLDAGRDPKCTTAPCAIYSIY